MLPIALALICHPIDTEARVLSRPSPAAIHPSWRGDDTLGLDWSLQVLREDGKYLIGDLRTPRGSVANKSVFVLRREWKCDNSTKG